MENRNSQFRTFNTVKHSNRKEREKRLAMSRILLLSICVCIIAILISLATFIFCSLAHELNAGKKPNDQPIDQPVDPLQYQDKAVPNSKVHEGPLIVVKQPDFKYLYPSIKLKSLKDLRTTQDGATPYQLYKEEQMETEAAAAADRMLTDYFRTFEKDGSLLLVDAYRTKADQSQYKTPAGYSEHETGYLFTLESVSGEKRSLLTADSSEDYSWIYDNCARYGIIARYPSDKVAITGISDYEECFRYVGVPHATYIKNHHLCLEEYNELLRTTYTGDNHLKIDGADGNRYEVYYVSASEGSETTLRVPVSNEYSISGDNLGGFIVTVKL